MFDPRTGLLSCFLAARAAEIAADPVAEDPWSAARQAVTAARDADPDLVAALDARDPARLKGVIDAWSSGKRPLPEHDREVLKKAMRAFRKRLRVTLLDAESTVGGGPLSGGRSTDITGITPPRDYPREVWLELARQGRLVNAGQGVFELAPGEPLGNA